MKGRLFFLYESEFFYIQSTTSDEEIGRESQALIQNPYYCFIYTVIPRFLESHTLTFGPWVTTTKLHNLWPTSEHRLTNNQTSQRYSVIRATKESHPSYVTGKVEVSPCRTLTKLMCIPSHHMKPCWASPGSSRGIGYSLSLVSLNLLYCQEWCTVRQ